MARWLSGLIIVVFVVAMGLVAAATSPHQARLTASADVLVGYPAGHGSGVHIGRGYIVTASHVVNGQKAITIEMSDGSKQSAEVLWQNPFYDVALLRIKNFSTIHASHLSCRTPRPGESIRANGNPVGEKFLAAWGHVAGNARSIGEWPEAVPVNMSIIPGMSGGPVYDEHGNVVGISVGILMMPLNMAMAVPIEFGAVVPGSTICSLMDRRA